MKSRFMRLTFVLYVTAAMAVAAVTAHSYMGPGSRMGADSSRYDMMGTGRWSRPASDSHFGRDHYLRRSFPGNRGDYDRGRSIFGFGVPLYYQTYAPNDHFGLYYVPPTYYSDDQSDANTTGLTYLTNSIGAIWLDPTILQVAWMGTGPILERLDFSLLDTFKRELRHVSAYGPPFRPSLVVPDGAAYLNVRAIGPGGFLLTEVTAALPDQQRRRE